MALLHDDPEGRSRTPPAQSRSRRRPPSRHPCGSRHSTTPRSGVGGGPSACAVPARCRTTGCARAPARTARQRSPATRAPARSAPVRAGARDEARLARRPKSAAAAPPTRDREAPRRSPGRAMSLCERPTGSPPAIALANGTSASSSTVPSARVPPGVSCSTRCRRPPRPVAPTRRTRPRPRPRRARARGMCRRHRSAEASDSLAVISWSRRVSSSRRAASAWARCRSTCSSAKPAWSANCRRSATRTSRARDDLRPRHDQDEIRGTATDRDRHAERRVQVETAHPLEPLATRPAGRRARTTLPACRRRSRGSESRPGPPPTRPAGARTASSRSARACARAAARAPPHLRRTSRQLRCRWPQRRSRRCRYGSEGRPEVSGRARVSLLLPLVEACALQRLSPEARGQRRDRGGLLVGGLDVAEEEAERTYHFPATETGTATARCA